MEPAISLRNAAFSYSCREIFSGLNLDLVAGDILCLLGPNGCGKTTLLRCLGGLLPLKEGDLRLNGRDMSRINDRERARVMGFVFQEHRILFPYSVLEVVRMGRAAHLALFSSPSQKDTGIAEKALETVGLIHLRDERYTGISGGERQLVLIARALAQEPSVLLLDEPTSHLDFGNQMLILEIISHLAQGSGLAILMATHFPDHALLASNKAVLMKDGGFIDCGPPELVITESNLKMLYGIDVKVVPGGNGTGKQVRIVVPLLRRER